MQELLTMRDVSLSFGKKPALKGLSFSVENGEIFGFLGPSGAGKTTTIKLLTRQLRADSGDITLFGEPISQLKNQAYDQIGVLTDNSGLYERLSVYDNLKLFADLKGIGKGAIDEVLGKVALAEEMQKPAKSLSKGMKQRLMLARAVLHKPRLLFLDEPTAALDPATTQSIHKLLRELNGEGTTIFLTTHNMEEADRLCGRVAFLHNGHIEEIGSPSELKLKYAKSEVEIRFADGSSSTAPKTAQGLLELAQQAEGKEISTVHSKEPNLEEIFLMLTGRALS